MRIYNRISKKEQRIAIILICLLITAVMCLFIASRVGFGQRIKLTNYTGREGSERAAKYPDSDFAVLSDIHFFDESLGVSGSAFEKDLNLDRKMLADSEKLLDTAIKEIRESDVKFVLIAGDLTKDGEKVNHEHVSEKLRGLTESGIKVYVVPGNHDINNYNAKRFEGDLTYPVESISSDEFAMLYDEFGYGDSIMRDENSLSYVAEPVPGLWVLAIDANRYKENTPSKPSIVGGRINQKSADWIESILSTAIAQDIAVIVLMHHGVVEHWSGQKTFSPDHIIKDYSLIGPFLASYNVRAVFSGHYHAQDITRAVFNGKYLYDIETGSLVTSPCPIRFCSFRDGILSVSSVNAAEKAGGDLKQKANEFLSRAVFNQARDLLVKFKVSEKDAEYFASVVSDSFAAHYAGDEDISLKPQIDTSSLGLWARIVYRTQRYMIDGLWNDLLPADSNLVIDFN